MTSELIYGVKKRRRLCEEPFCYRLTQQCWAVKAAVGFHQQAFNASNPAVRCRAAVKNMIEVEFFSCAPNYGCHKFILLLFQRIYCSLSKLVIKVSEIIFGRALWWQPAIWGQNPRITTDEFMSDLDRDFESRISPEGSQLWFGGVAFREIACSIWEGNSFCAYACS